MSDQKKIKNQKDSEDGNALVKAMRSELSRDRIQRRFEESAIMFGSSKRREAARRRLPKEKIFQEEIILSQDNEIAGSELTNKHGLTRLKLNTAVQGEQLTAYSMDGDAIKPQFVSVDRQKINFAYSNGDILYDAETDCLYDSEELKDFLEKIRKPRPDTQKRILFAYILRCYKFSSEKIADLYEDIDEINFKEDTDVVGKVDQDVMRGKRFFNDIQKLLK